MRPEIQKLWADALKSGKYKQGKNALAVQNIHSGDFKFCCLGVLCELALDAGLGLAVSSYEGTQLRAYGDGSGWSTTLLPPNVSEWAGVASWPGTVHFDMTDYAGSDNKYFLENQSRALDRVGKFVTTANLLNDLYGFTFNEIAALIDQGRIVAESC